ncbi:MAG: tetratricopeptide repeat protein [Actinomycetota bacterium]
MGPPVGAPQQLTSFVGREAELGELHDALLQTRLLSVIGPGGCGKTRLALELVSADSHEVSDVYFVDLAPLRDPELVAGAIADVVGAPDDGGSRIEAVRNAVGARDSIVVLDNCEHVLAACASTTADLLAHCANLVVVATSREPLDVAGENAWLVPSMSHPGPGDVPPISEFGSFDGLQLFIERASAVQRTFALSATNGSAIARVVARLDGIPLAIELAAAWVRVLGPQEIADRLDDRFRLLTRGAAEAPPRHQTLRATVEWSYDLLSERQRTTFARLAVFVGGFDVDAAEEVCSIDMAQSDVLDDLHDLVRASMVVSEPAGDRSRSSMLETIRAYAQERLEVTNEIPALRDRHLEWFADLADIARPSLEGPEPEPWLDRLEKEVANVRSALEWSLGSGDAASGLRLATKLCDFWEYRSHHAEGLSWIERTLASADGVGSLLLSQSLGVAGILAYRLGDLERSKALHERVLELRREASDEHGVSNTLRNLGNIAFRSERLDEAQAMYEESIEIAQRLGDPAAVAQTLINLGALFTDRGEYERSRSVQEEALVELRAIGAPESIAIALNNLGKLALGLGELDVARSHFEEALAIFQRLGDQGKMAPLLQALGVVAWKREDMTRAAELYGRAIAIHRELDARDGLAEHLVGLGRLRCEMGSVNDGIGHFVEALVLFDQLDVPRHAATVLEYIAQNLDEDPPKAARLLGAADVLRASRDVRLGDDDRAALDTMIEEVRAATGADAFEREWSVGRSMTVDEAIDDASASQAPAGRQLAFIANGEYWEVTFEHRSFRLRDTKGVRYLAALVQQPGVEVHAAALVLVEAGAPSRSTTGRDAREPGMHMAERSDAGAMLDPQAIEAYRERIVELEDDLAEAESFADTERASRARAEIGAITDELRRAVGRGGRIPRAASDDERARVNVTRAIRSAIARISGQDRRLGLHLSESISTGTFCSYRSY